MKAWDKSEVQGRGRRYWFCSVPAAFAFMQARRARGYNAVRDGRTVWVPFARKINDDIRAQRAGKDT